MSSLELSERHRTLVPPVDLRRLQLLVASRLAIAGLFAGALVARWNGVVWAETLAVGTALLLVGIVVIFSGAIRILVFDVAPTSLFVLWLTLFGWSIAADPAPVASVEPISGQVSGSATDVPSAALATLPSRKTLRAYGGLSVVVGSEWSRVVRPLPEPFELVVTDGVALSFSADPYSLDEDAEDVASVADEMTQAIAEEEGLILLETSNGSIEGFPTAERVLATKDRTEYCLLVVTDRDGLRLVGRGDTFAEFGDRDVVGELRRVAASLRAVDEGEEPRTTSPREAEGKEAS